MLSMGTEVQQENDQALVVERHRAINKVGLAGRFFAETLSLQECFQLVCHYILAVNDLVIEKSPKAEARITEETPSYSGERK